MLSSHPRFRRHRSRRHTGRLVSSIALVLIGCAGFYLALQWFRSDAEDVQATVVEAVVAKGSYEEQLSAPSHELSAPLVSVFDGQHTGRVQVYPAPGSVEIIVLAYLPTLDMTADSYHVWLLKDGLADVKDMGQLTPRADGSWVLNFMAGPTTGIADPSTYHALVIMREPNDANLAPSGNRIATAEF